MGLDYFLAAALLAGRFAAFFAAGRFFAAFFAAGRFLAAAFFAGAFFFAAGRFAAFFAAGRFLAAAFLAGAFFFAAGRLAAFFAGAFLATAFFFAAGATFPPWDSTLNQFGTSSAPPWCSRNRYRIDKRVLAHVPPSFTAVRRLIAVHGPTRKSASQKRHTDVSLDVHLLRRRTFKSSLALKTNVKHFEVFLRQMFFMHSDVGIYLGRGVHGDATSGNERSTLVLGPSRSGKTSSIVVPNLLITNRSCVVTSTKNDVVSLMSRSRRDAATLLFDPSGTVRTPQDVHRIGYSPIRQSFSWDGAILASRSLIDIARRGRGDRSDDHWTERAGALVAPLLHATALRNESLGQLASRVDERRCDDVVHELKERYGEHHPSVSLLRGVLATEERERSSIWSTTSGLFAGVRTEAARASSREAPLDLDAFLSGPHQLHIVAPSRHQAVTIPLVVGLIEELVHATYDRHHEGARLLLALDELANVAPLPRLASIVSEGGGQGVLTLACLQDLSQARSRWGTSADGFLSLFPTTVVLPGIADRATLEMLRGLAGRSLFEMPTLQYGPKGRRAGRSTSWVERDRASMSDLAHGRPGYAMGLDASKQMKWVELTPAHSDPRFRRYLERSERSRESRER
jgi:type IV secretion system protein VirD4